MTESDEWLREHKGALVRTVGMIWECYDDCRCTQAVVTSYYRNLKAWNARVPVNDWAGEFHADGEPGADRELAIYRRALKETDPDLEAAIEWQRGVDYDLT